jgi:ketosteroid isomerase-like protein
MKGVDFKRVNSFDFLQTEVRGNTAWTSYFNQADMQINGTPRQVRWLESAVLVKEAGGWKVKVLHSTVIRPKEGKR